MLIYVSFRALQTMVFGPRASTAKRAWAGRSGSLIAAMLLANVVLQASNLLGIPFERGPAPYVVGVAFYLASGGLAFFRLLQLPIEDGIEK
jgi:hypothetical protein